MKNKWALLLTGLLTCFLGNAQQAVNSFLVDQSFTYFNPGSVPVGSLCEASNQKLYGMTALGGLNNHGVLYEWDPASDTYTKKLDFDGAQKGSLPPASLIKADNGKLYGMTEYGGENDEGVLFEWDPATNTYTKKLDFSRFENGRFPNGSLVQGDNGKLYGMTRMGGIYDEGVLFEFDPVKNICTKKLDFNEIETGAMPQGSLIQADNGKLYGMTGGGGENLYGVLFEWDITTDTYIKKIDFSIDSGGNPVGSLIQLTNGRIYGATSSGGIGDGGVLFEWDPSTNTYTKERDFNYSLFGVEYGYSPLSSFIEADNGNIYGIAHGGIHASGVLFEWDPVNKIYTRKFIFNYLENGSDPNFLMKATNGKIYITTKNGLSNEQGMHFEKGAIFEWEPILNICTKKFGFRDTVTELNNLAFRKPVTQSSTKYGSIPERAVDGNTDGIWGHGSVSHTNYDVNAWLEIDLGGVYNISTIELWNRTDACCMARLSDFYVLASDVPFQSKELTKTLNQSGVWHIHESGFPNPSNTYTVDRTARFIRIQSSHTVELNIAEVKVMGSLNKPQPVLTNVALNKTARQSSTCYGGTADRAVDGNSNGLWANGSVTHTCADYKAWWELDLGGIYNISSIELFNRTDPSSISRLSNYYLLISDEPFVSQELNATLNQPGIWQQFNPEYPDPSKNFQVGRTGRYVRIQCLYQTELNIAEVVVMGSLNTPQTEPVNVAHNKPVTQSSTQYGGVPERAVDGNTDGLWSSGSVTHTYADNNAWWEADLGGSYQVNTIEVWNRTNSCCKARLNNFYIFVSEEPFLSKQLDVTLSQSYVWRTYQSDFPDPSFTFNVNRTARFIRIQKDGTTELNLAEVKVMGLPTDNTFKSTEKKFSGDEPPEMDISIYPVPFSDVIHVESARIMNSIELFNIMGESLIIEQCESSSAEINTEILVPGLYFARIRLSNDNIKTFTIIKSDK